MVGQNASQRKKPLSPLKQSEMLRAYFVILTGSVFQVLHFLLTQHYLSVEPFCIGKHRIVFSIFAVTLNGNEIVKPLFIGIFCNVLCGKE